MVTLTSSCLPVTVGLDDAAAGRAVDDRGLELGLDAQHLLLHLLGHPLQVGHAHGCAPPRGRSSVSLADARRRAASGRGRSADLADVDEVVREDAPRLGDERPSPSSARRRRARCWSTTQRTPTSRPRTAADAGLELGASCARRCPCRKACSSGKPRVTTLPSTATGRHSVMSGSVGGLHRARDDRPASRRGSGRGRGSTSAGSAAALPAAAVAARAPARRRRGSRRGGRGRRATGRRRRRRRRGVRRRAPASGGRGVGAARRLVAAAARRGRGLGGRRPPGSARRSAARSAAGRRRAGGPGAGAAGDGRSRRRPGGRRGRGSRRREERQLELEAQAADARAVRVDRGEAPGGSASRGDGLGVAGSPSVGDEPRRGSRRPPGRAASAGRGRAPRGRRGARCPAAASPSTSASTNASTASASASPSRSRTRRSSMIVRRRRQELVEHRLGVAHAAGGEAGDELDSASGSAVRPSASRMRASLPSISGDRQPPDVEALEARQDGRREARRVGRGEHEDDERRAAPRAT